MSTLLQRAAQAARNENVSRETLPGQATEFGNGNDTTDKLIRLPLAMIADNPWQTRLVYADIEELAEDIRRNGLLQPPTGRMVSSESLENMPDAHYRLPAWQIASRLNNGESADWHVQLSIGHRRLRACKLAGLETIPVFLRPISDEDMARQAWAENEQRKDISPVEEARAIRGMMDSFGWTQERVSERLGLARSTVANKLRLLSLPEDVQQQVMAGQVGERHARALLTLADDPATLATLAARSVEKSLSARELEDEAARERKRIDAENEKRRQIATVDALGLGVPWIEMRDNNTSYFRPGSNWADAALLENGQCGPGVCDCLRFHCLSPHEVAFYDKSAFAHPCYDDAPAVVYACCQDQRARQKSAQLHQSTADTAEKERREAEEEKARQEAEEEKARRIAVAAKLIDSILARWPLDALWMDARFWKFAAEHVRYEFRSAIDAGESLAEMQMNILRACIIVKAHERGLGYVIDLAATSQNRQALFIALGNKEAQPGPGDSQATNWLDGWVYEDEEEWMYFLEEGGHIPAPLEIQRPRVALRFIEQAGDKTTRGHLWKRYNELSDQ